MSQVGRERSLQYSTNGLLTLTYKGPLDEPTGTNTLQDSRVLQQLPGVRLVLPSNRRRSRSSR